MRSVHSIGTRALSLAMAALGVALVVQALDAAGGAGGTLVRLLLGLLFIAAGAGRLYAASRRTARGKRTRT